MSGTSMAAPYTTGIAALRLCQNPSLSARELREELMASVIKVNGVRGVTGLANFQAPSMERTQAIAAAKSPPRGKKLRTSRRRRGDTNTGKDSVHA